ncbi:MAG: hypothetical protein KBG15_19715 [Kofleriaceae bacterium]|nr:hypothetical protein [Kofleriaceae bacterium]
MSDAPYNRLAGEVAISVAAAATRPLREACERLALLVDALERFVTTSSGPAPYPYKSLQVLRNDLTDAYLQASAAARTLVDLEAALAADREAGTLDVRREVELGLSLAEHHVSVATELLVDVIDVPQARGARGVLALVVAQLVAWCAASARQQTGSTLTVRVTASANRILVTVADNGAGFETLPDFLRTLPAALGVQPRDVLASVALGQGCVFELYFDAVAP